MEIPKLITKHQLSLVLQALKKLLSFKADREEVVLRSEIEEYVNNMIENARPAETTSEDIIEWMDQENAITLLASTSGQVYVTNDNKILII